MNLKISPSARAWSDNRQNRQRSPFQCRHSVALADTAIPTPAPVSRLRRGEDGQIVDRILKISRPSLTFFAYSQAKRIRRKKKYYTIDTALRRAVTTRPSASRLKRIWHL